MHCKRKLLHTCTLIQCFSPCFLHYCTQAVGASTRIFELLDRVSEIRDGTDVLDHLKGGILQYVFMMLSIAFVLCNFRNKI